jgi:thiamine pyrophosphokinase
MPKLNRYLLFLNYRYPYEDFLFHRRRMKGSVAVAVDGGVRFFLKNNILPDIIIGDFDSSPPLSKKYLSRMEVIAFPTAKDKTDSQLALEMALERGAGEIEIFGGVSSSEIDHTLGNLFLLELVNKFNRDYKDKVKARLVGPGYEAAMIENGRGDFEGNRGDFLSIIPLSANPVVEFTGLVYPSPKKPLRIGDSLSLRNQFSGRHAHIKVKGKAVVVVLRRK